MPILDLFINKNKLSNVIKNLEENKDNLREIVDTEVMNAVKNKYGQVEYPTIAEKYHRKIDQIKSSLYQKYRKEIDAQLSQLEVMKTEISQ